MGWGGAITLMLLAISSDVKLRLRHGLGFGWGGAITFMLLAISSEMCGSEKRPSSQSHKTL